MCWHKWTKWNKPIVIYILSKEHFNGREYPVNKPVLCQTRECEKCGKVQERKIFN